MAKKEKKTTRRRKKRVVADECYFEKTGTTPDYKDVLILRRFISDRGKILPQSSTGVSAKNQRLLTKEIKKARFMALLPFTDRHAI